MEPKTENERWSQTPTPSPQQPAKIHGANRLTYTQFLKHLVRLNLDQRRDEDINLGSGLRYAHNHMPSRRWSESNICAFLSLRATITKRSDVLAQRDSQTTSRERRDEEAKTYLRSVSGPHLPCWCLLLLPLPRPRCCLRRRPCGPPRARSGASRGLGALAEDATSEDEEDARGFRERRRDGAGRGGEERGSVVSVGAPLPHGWVGTWESGSPSFSWNTPPDTALFGPFFPLASFAVAVLLRPKKRGHPRGLARSPPFARLGSQSFFLSARRRQGPDPSG